MLRELRVRNLAVIESLTVPFGPGLNVLTGETGAGKSILIDALTLLLGERAQPAETIRAGAETATIEAVFDAPSKSPVAAVLQEHGIALENGQLLVRRELVRGGRGRVFLNDTNTTLALLEKLGEALVEVHGQHEHQALLRPGRHLDLLDAFAGLGILRDRLRQRHEEWRSASTELDALRASARDRVARIAQYRESIAEIDAARLRSGEDEDLREERRRLMNAERLAEGATGAYRELYDDPASAVERAGRAATHLRELARIDPAVQPTLQALDTALVHLDETARALRSYRDAVVFDPPRLDAIERRVDEIGRLKRKYGESVEAVLAFRAKVESDLEGLAHAGEDEGRLAERVDRLRTELVTRATDLAERRDQAVGRLEASVLAELAALDLEAAVFRVRLARERAGHGDLAVGPEAWRLGPRGVDQAEFLFSGNAGEDARPLARIASGGELSRTMLALKVVLAATDAVPVLIFDEVDVGIGGKTADTVGKKLRQVARVRQVLCVTHLPQIAAYADQHFRVEKREEEGRTATTVAALVRNDRVREVARMLGGESVTDTSLQHARELITQARGK
ncbi:MAG TPA: DNA repair protein RecN [Methylomirabilota bacterium]|nr:DNA repair protein RecN [Methylomirabilota bacterium]